ncbi:MAG TPA: hypothetical protein VGP21_07265 [Opitutaceae bacterium]|nr:hypothetical protein [Opitutaceae bacterium]
MKSNRYQVTRASGSLTPDTCYLSLDTFFPDSRHAFIVTTPRNYLLTFLALTTLGGAILAWKQHLEIIALRGEVQAKDWDAQQRLHALEAEVADARAKAKTVVLANGAPSDDQAQHDERGPFGRWASRMNDPQFAARMAARDNAQISLAYGPLFKQLAQQLGLTPAQLAAFQNLLAEKQANARDVLSAAEQEGLNPRDPNDRADIAQLIGQGNAQTESQIAAGIGQAAYTQYLQYEQALPAVNAVTRLQTYLTNAGVALTPSQISAITPIIEDSPPTNPNSIRPLLEGPNYAAPITPPIINKISPSLTPPQIPILKNYHIANSGFPGGGGAP